MIGCEKIVFITWIIITNSTTIKL